MSPINNKLAAALLLLSAPAFAAGGVCILCPPGHDCSTGTPVLKGTTNQVFARTAAGTAWQAYEPPALTWDNITDKPATFAPAAHTHDYVPPARTVNGKALSADITLTASELGIVPNTRTIAGLALSDDIAVAQLQGILDECPPYPAAGISGSDNVASLCSSTGGTPGYTGNPTNSSGSWCWCNVKRFVKGSLFGIRVCEYSSNWVLLGDQSGYCAGSCNSNCKSHVPVW